MAQAQPINIWKALLVGQMIVNLPAVAIRLVALFLGSLLAPWGELALIIGSLLAWVWWSYTVPRWRDWAQRRGANSDQLQKFAFRTGLTWPKGSLFERTEFRRK